MLFRIFDRERLELVPALCFTGPLAELENPSEIGSVPASRLRDERGAAVPLGNSMPWYDPLHHDVQREIGAIIEELVTRYASHSSFGGVSLVCRPGASSLLPGSKWGYSEAVIADFVREWEATADGSGSRNETTDRYREAWTDFRCRRLAAWYRDLSSIVRRYRESTRLYLAAIDLHTHGDLAQALSPSLHRPSNPVIAVRDMGWDPSLWESDTVILLRGHTVAPSESLTDHRRDVAMRLSSGLQEHWNKTGYAAELIFHRPHWLIWQGMEDHPAFSATEPPWRLQHWSLPGYVALQRFATSLASRDSLLIVDGGLFLASGNREHADDWSGKFSALPAVRFESVESSRNPGTRYPIVVRQQTVGTRWYAYIVNTTPWFAEVNAKWSQPPLAAVENITPLATAGNLRDAAANPSWQIAPFGLIVLTSADTNTRLADFEFTFPEAAFEQVRRTIHGMQAALYAAGPTTPLSDLDQYAFSSISKLSDGWRFDPQHVSNLELASPRSTSSKISDTGNASERALRMQSQGDVVWIRSPAFPVPETGRLSVIAAVRTDEGQQQPALRISVESNDGIHHYYRFGSVGGDEALPVAQLTTHWKQFVVHFDDIPVEPGRTVQIGFDLMGAGQVWIGDIKLYDRWLDESDTKAIAQQLATAGALAESAQSLDQSRRILEGYWPQFVETWIGNPRRTSSIIQTAVEPAEYRDEHSNDEGTINPWRRLPRRLFPLR